MGEQPAIVEHWTVSRHGLVISGSPAEIESIALALHLPDDAPVYLSASEAQLALWGESLAEYARAYGRLERRPIPPSHFVVADHAQAL